MSRLTDICPPLTEPSFYDSVAQNDKVLFSGSNGTIQWCAEGDTAWKSLGKFQDPSSDFGLVENYSASNDNYAAGVDYSRNIVFFSGGPGLTSCSFDSDANLIYITTNNVLSKIFQGKIGVDETLKLLFVNNSGSKAISCFSYDENGDNITFLYTHTLEAYSAGLDLILDTGRQFLFFADQYPTLGMRSFTYTALALTPVGNYATTNHGFGSVEIDTVNKKLFGCHWYFNSPVGLETLSYDDFAVITPVDMSAPISGGVGECHAVVVDLTRSLVFMGYWDNVYSAKLASFSFDGSFNLTPLAIFSDPGITFTEFSSIDVTKKYVFLTSGGPAKIEYNDAGTTLTLISQIPSPLSGLITVSVPAYEFIFVGTSYRGFRTYTYTSFIDRFYRALTTFEGDVYASGGTALVRLDYVGPSWTATKVCDAISGYTVIPSLGVHDGRLYGSASGRLYRMNLAKDAWELVAPVYPSNFWMAFLTSFNGRLYGTASGKLFRLNLAGDAWEQVVGVTGSSDNALGTHNNKLYMTTSGGSQGYLYELNDTEDGWIYLAAAGIGNYVLTKPLSHQNILIIGGYSSGYLSTGPASYFNEAKSLFRTISSGIFSQNLLQAPVIMNGKLYFGTLSSSVTEYGSGRLFRLDPTLPIVTNTYLWDEDNYFYGWVGVGMGRFIESEYSRTQENLSVDPLWPARSADGITWNEISIIPLLSPLYDTLSRYQTHKKGNYAPVSLWASFNSYLYMGANRRINYVPEWSATISRTSDGVNWSEVFLSSDVSTVKSLIVYNSAIYAAVQVIEATYVASKIYKSTDGTTWNLIKTFDEGVGTSLIVEALVEFQSNLYMVMGSYVYISKDEGVTWENTQGYTIGRESLGSIANNDFIYFYGSDVN